MIGQVTDLGFFGADGYNPPRIPIYDEEPGNLNGFVLRSDLLLAQARGNTDSKLSTYRREMSALLVSSSLSQAFDEFLRQRAHIMIIVDEYCGYPDARRYPGDAARPGDCR